MRSSARHGSPGPAVLALSAALLVGCTGGDVAEPARDSARASDDAVAPAGHELPTVGTRDTTIGSSDATVTLNSVIIDGEEMTVRFTVENHGPGALRVRDAFNDSGLGGWDDDADGVSVLDGANDRLHLAALDQQGQCVCSHSLDWFLVEPGDMGVLSTTFAAVADDVDTVTVSIPGVRPFPNVPMTR